MFESAMNTMVGVIPLAMVGGLAMGMTNNMMNMANQNNRRVVYVEDDEPVRVVRRTRKKVRVVSEPDNIWTRIYGPMR